MNNNIIYFCGFILSILIIQSCTYSKSKTGNIETENQSPKILFLNIELSKNKNNSTTAKLIDKILVDGKIKKNNLTISKPRIGDFKCIELDERENPVESFYLNNPLNKRVEYVKDDGQLASKNVELDTATLSIRMQMHQQTKTIAIEQITDKTNKTERVTIIKLN